MLFSRLQVVTMRQSWPILISLVANSFAKVYTVVLPICCGYVDWTDDFTYNFTECNKTVEDPYSLYKSEWKGHNVEWMLNGTPIMCSPHFEVPEDIYDINGDGSLSYPCQGVSCCGNPLPEIYYVSDWEENREFCLDHFNGTIKAHMCARPEIQPPSPSLLRVSCMIISALMLVITIVINLTEDSVKKESYVPYLVSQSISLVIAFLCLAWLQSSIKIESAFRCWHCLLIGYFLQYFFLAAFFWMNAKCINVYMNMSQLTVPKCNKLLAAKVRRRIFRKFSLYAWGMPLLITVATYSLQMSGIIKDPRMRPDVGSRNFTCFFQAVTVKWIYFYGPLSIIIMANLILFILTATVLVKQRANIFSNVGRRKDKSRLQKEIWFFNQYLKLFVVNGSSWIFEVLEFSFNHEEDSWQHIFWQVADTFNCLQGVFIFYFFVCQKEIIVRKLFCCQRTPKCTTSDGVSRRCPDGRKRLVVESPDTTEMEISINVTTKMRCNIEPCVPLSKTISMVFNKTAESVEFESCLEDDENDSETESDKDFK